MSDNNSGSMTAIVAVIAVIVIVAVGFFAMQSMRGTGAAGGGAPSVNVKLPTGQGQ